MTCWTIGAAHIKTPRLKCAPKIKPNQIINNSNNYNLYKNIISLQER